MRYAKWNEIKSYNCYDNKTHIWPSHREEITAIYRLLENTAIN